MNRVSHVLFLLLGAACAAADPLDGADARIEQHRKGTVIIEVASSGRPLAGARVEIRQTRHAFLFGCNIFSLDPDAPGEAQHRYQARFKDLLNYATLPFYWGAYEPARGRTGAARLRRMAEWCHANGIEVKGHPVVWHQVFPAWVTAQEPFEPLLENRIAGTVGEFKGLVDRWDVVNESLVAPTQANALGVWVKRLGPATAVEKCLRWAAAANPEGTFLVNDFKVSPEYEAEIATLRERKAPFHAVGIQSHMHGGEWQLDHTWQVCETYARLGLPIHFTELTVLSGPKEKPMKDWWSDRASWPTTPEDEARQADYVERFYTLLFSHPAVEAITWWDLSDAYSWMRAPAGLLRKDMSPKPVYERLSARIKGTWWTKQAAGVTGADGRVELRGFLGSYALDVTTPDGRTKTQTFDLGKGEPAVVRADF